MGHNNNNAHAQHDSRNTARLVIAAVCPAATFLSRWDLTKNTQNPAKSRHTMTMAAMAAPWRAVVVDDDGGGAVLGQVP